MSRPYIVAIAAIIVLISTFGWLGATLEWSGGAITLTLVGIAVLAILAVGLLALLERRNRSR